MSILIDADKLKDKLPHIATSELTDKHGNFHPSGLFSELIFGPQNTIQRRTKLALIDLRCRIVHPEIYKILKRLYKPFINIIHQKEAYIFDRDNSKHPLLTQEEYEKEHQFDSSLVPKPRTGMTFLLNIWDQIKTIPNIDPNKNPERYKLWTAIKSLAPTEIFIRYLIVIPPAFRPLVKTEQYTHIDEINNLYIDCFNHARVLSQQDQFDETMFNVTASRLQNTVNELFEQIKLRISKKQGIIRRDLLGKRVDFSARAVITPDPNLNVHEAGIPFKIICQVYQPFLIHFLTHQLQSDPELAKQYRSSLADIDPNLKSYPVTVPGITLLLRDIYSGKLGPDTAVYQFVKKLLKDTNYLYDKPILLKRDPALHRESVTAFHPVIVDDDTIHVEPSATGMANADFDGDSINGKIRLRAHLNIKSRKCKNSGIFGLTSSRSSVIIHDITELHKVTIEEVFRHVTNNPGDSKDDQSSNTT